SFQSCITKDEEDAVDELLKENFDADELIDVLNRFDCRKVLTKKKPESLFSKNNREVPGTWLMMLHYKDELTTAERL
ncbi:hypothetical protein pdam_00026006, partial [Pocillopora damicornis]